MAGLIIWCLVNPVRDLLGEWFNTKSIKYIEGICSEVEDKMFDYKLATIDGYKVMISTLNHDVKVGDYYRCSIDGSIAPYIMEYLLKDAKMKAIKECKRV